MDKDAAGSTAVHPGSSRGLWSAMVLHEHAHYNLWEVSMSIQLDLEATYDGLDVAETAKIALELRDLGMPDEMINEMLEHYRDKEKSSDKNE